MLDHADNVFDLNAVLHPGTVFDHPRDVVADAALSLSEKRAILASWASDAAAVTSNPALREEMARELGVDLKSQPKPTVRWQGNQAFDKDGNPITVLPPTNTRSN